MSIASPSVARSPVPPKAVPAPTQTSAPDTFGRRFVRAVCATCLISTFWPLVRIAGVITLFDALTPIAVLCGLIYMPKERGPNLGGLTLAVAGVAVLALAGLISYPSSNDSMGHLQKVATIAVALGGVVGVAYVLINRKIFSANEALTLLALSATASSWVVILQGRLHILTNLIPLVTTVEVSTRMTGLCEHPIEAGITAAFGVVLALGLATRQNRWMTWLPLMAINLYSLVYSASLTAVLAFMMGAFLWGIYARAYKVMIIGALVGVLGITAALSYTGLGLLTSRLDALASNQGSYTTIQSREMQWSQALEMVEPSTLIVGNGYSPTDMPGGREIHNGLVAALFHFGLLGLTSQILLIGFFVSRLAQGESRDLKAIMLGCIAIFLLSYMTGPALSRRSLWVPLIVLGAYLTRQTVTALLPTPAVARPAAPPKPARPVLLGPPGRGNNGQ